jgi:hypothetical protein
VTNGGYTIPRVQLVAADGKKTDAKFFRNGTQMRIDLATPLATGQKAVIEIDWSFIVPEGGRNGRGVREKVKDGWLYEIAQWFPRAAVYDDVNGWQNVQFYGQGEFYLEFGNYDVSVTVPHDHIVRATGALMNPLQTMTATQRARLATALAGDTAVFIVKADEVGQASARPAGTAPITWRFKAENVRDFAWASSKTYVWDAAGFRYQPGGRVIELHSVYPRDAMPLWDKISTKAIRQTMITYGRLAFEYPYPQASNVHGPVFGMEYPMIAFCGARPRARRHLRQVARVRAGVGDHPRGGAQLVPDDRRERRAPVDVDGRGPELVPRVLRIARLRRGLAEADDARTGAEPRRTTCARRTRCRS